MKKLTMKLLLYIFLFPSDKSRRLGDSLRVLRLGDGVSSVVVHWSTRLLFLLSRRRLFFLLSSRWCCSGHLRLSRRLWIFKNSSVVHRNPFSSHTPKSFVVFIKVVVVVVVVRKSTRCCWSTLLKRFFFKVVVVFDKGTSGGVRDARWYVVFIL